MFRALLLAIACVHAFPAKPAEFVYAAEFSYYLHPKPTWERELVWLKNLGVRTIAFSIPWKWHSSLDGRIDLEGRTSPRGDLIGFLRLLRRLELQAWIRLPADGEDQRRRFAGVESTLAPYLEKHGGPIVFIEPELPPPAPVVSLSALDPDASIRSRAAIATRRGSLLWRNVEDGLVPLSSEFLKGAVSFNGVERAGGTTALRRDASLLRRWGPLLGEMGVERRLRNLPKGVDAVELISPSASALAISNQGEVPFRGVLKTSKRALRGIEIGPGQTRWLPLDVSLSGSGLCDDCSNFAPPDRILYATAELHGIEYENGILAMEFYAPVPGEVFLRLSRKPVGPFLAAGRPREFGWDDRSMTARLPIPAGSGQLHKVRVGFAIEAPESSGFFVNPRRLIAGETNRVQAMFSSEALALRSRLLTPRNFTSKAIATSPTETDYEVAVPAEAAHGDWVELALEADGLRLGRTRLQLFRPVSMRLRDAVGLHFGSDSKVLADPPLAEAGRELHVIVRNNYPAIRNYVVEVESDGLNFLTSKAEFAVGETAERDVMFRLADARSKSGVFEARIRLSGASGSELPLRLVAIRRTESLAYSHDLDGDGSPEWILENSKVRAVFSPRSGGRWLEFLWKDSEWNALPATGALAGSGAVSVRALNENGAARLEMEGDGWRRTVRLNGEEGRLEIEQSTPLFTEELRRRKEDTLVFEVTRISLQRAVFLLDRLKSDSKEGDKLQ
ncbi:MAG: hypothetical protein WD696_19110 [Bryobacteraceae bacterium]